MKTKQLALYNKLESKFCKELVDDPSEGSLPKLDLMRDYFHKSLLTIRNTRPALSKIYREKLITLLKKQVYNFLNEDNSMILGSYGINTYVIAPVESKGELYFTLAGGRSFTRAGDYEYDLIIFNPIIVSDPNKVIEYFVKRYPNAAFENSISYKLLYEVKQEEEQLRQKSQNEFRRSLATATNFQKNKKKWLKMIKPLVYPTVNIPLISKDTYTKVYVKASFYGGLAYTKLHKEWVIIHGSGVLLMDGIKSSNDTQVILQRVVRLLNWNRPLSTIQKELTPELKETLLKMKLNPYSDPYLL